VVLAQQTATHLTHSRQLLLADLFRVAPEPTWTSEALRAGSPTYNTKVCQGTLKNWVSVDHKGKGHTSVGLSTRYYRIVVRYVSKCKKYARNEALRSGTNPLSLSPHLTQNCDSSSHDQMHDSMTPLEVPHSVHRRDVHTSS